MKQIPLNELLEDLAASKMDIAFIDKLFGPEQAKYVERRAVNIRIVETIEDELQRRNVVLITTGRMHGTSSHD